MLVRVHSRTRPATVAILAVSGATPGGQTWGGAITTRRLQTRREADMNATDPSRACPEPVIIDRWPWPCVYAEGHAGDHRPPAEAAWCPRPLRDMDREELVPAASLAYTQLETERREARESLARAEQWGARVARLTRYVVEHTKRSTGAHDPGCWMRHAHCLAFAIWGAGGLEDAERHLADLAISPAGPRRVA